MSKSAKSAQVNKTYIFLPYAGLILIAISFPAYLAGVLTLPANLILFIQKLGGGMAAEWYKISAIYLVAAILMVPTIALSILAIKDMQAMKLKGWRQMSAVVSLYLLTTLLLALPSVMTIPRNTYGYTSYIFSVGYHLAYFSLGLFFGYLLRKYKNAYSK